MMTASWLTIGVFIFATAMLGTNANADDPRNYRTYGDVEVLTNIDKFTDDVKAHAVVIRELPGRRDLAPAIDSVMLLCNPVGPTLGVNTSLFGFMVGRGVTLKFRFDKAKAETFVMRVASDDHFVRRLSTSRGVAFVKSFEQATTLLLQLEWRGRTATAEFDLDGSAEAVANWKARCEVSGW